MCAKLTNEEFIKMVNPESKGFQIIGQYINSATPIDVQCELGHIWSPIPRNLIHCNSGCPYCAGKKVWVGFNDLWTTRPDVAKLLKNPDDGYRYTKGSNKKLAFICPGCGAISNKVLDMVCRYGFACNKCSDGISYPNKFGRAILDQLCVQNFQCEYQPDWAKPYFYDNYFEHQGRQYILEMDGWFHYQESEFSRRSLEEQKNADLIKDQMAMQHNIEVIHIDCLKSDCEYIKNSILHSRLNDILDLSNVDWSLCDAKSQKNIIQEVCDLYNNETHDLNEIKNKLHISLWAVQKYVKIGSDVGWCNYTIDVSRQEGRKKTMVSVNVIDDDNNIIHQFKGIKKCAEDMTSLYNISFNTPNIIKSCKTYKPYKGFNFRYAETNC